MSCIVQVTGKRKKIVRPYNPGLQRLEEKHVFTWDYSKGQYYNNVTKKHINNATALRYGRFYSKYSWDIPFSIALGLKKQRKRYTEKKWVTEASPSGIQTRKGKTVKTPKKRKPSEIVIWRPQTPVSRSRNIIFATDRMNMEGSTMYGYVRVKQKPHITVTSEAHLQKAKHDVGELIYNKLRPQAERLLQAYGPHLARKRWRIAGKIGIFITGFTEATHGEPGTHEDRELNYEEIKRGKIANPRWFNPTASMSLDAPGALDSTLNDLYEIGINALNKIKLSYCKKVEIPEVLISIFNFKELTKAEKRRATKKGIWD